MGKNVNSDAIYDARALGIPKMVTLGFQHMFAMFGATVLVPALTGLDVATTLLFAGLGTLLFHFLAKGKVPAFLGSSFAFLAGYFAIAPNGEKELLPYACFGVACAGLMYVILAAFFKAFGTKRVMRYRPDSVLFRSSELRRQLVDCSGRYPDRRHRQHLGQGHDKDHPDPAWRPGFLSLRHDHRSCRP